MASERIPDQTAPAGDGEPAAPPPRRVNPLALAWRYDRVWLALSVVAGIVTGGTFLMMALVMREVGAHPSATIPTTVGGIMLLFVSPGWVIFDTWLDYRQLSKRPAMPDPSAE